MLWWKEDVYEDKRHVEIYEFYLVVNSGTISVHNLAVDESSLPEIEGFTQETIKRGETLLDGSTTTKGFSIDKLGASYLVSVSKDGGAASYVDDGATFTENGKYTITTITKLGKQLTKTVYVYNGGADSGYATYFGDSIVDGNRTFRYGDYPTHTKGSSVQINAVANNVPILTGKIINTTTGEEFALASNRNGQKFDLAVGSYCADFYSGETASGTVYHYKAYFNIIDENSAPYVNYDNLNKTQRLSDLTTKHYEVAYQTTAGGYIFVCFSLDSYDEAFNYAYEIEKRFIEQTNDGLYYKSQDNPNVKVKYYDYVAMTGVLNYYARQNVEYNYFNPIDAFTYQTCENNLLEQLESLSIKESIKVFPSQAEKDKLINRQPFINDFTFIKVADYDVVSVNAYCHKNGKNYAIEFGKDVSQQLTVSSKYTITETNIYGDTRSYDAYYATTNETTSSWKVNYNGVSLTIDVSANSTTNNKMTVNADTISLVYIENLLDPMSIVTIKAPDVYSFEIKCLVNELANIGLYKKGTYQLTFVDRVGNSYQLIINITGNSRYHEVIKGGTISYTETHNEIYLNSRTEDEEITLNATALKSAIDRIVNENHYTTISYTNYERYLNEAIQVYQTPSATQAQIDKATLNLENAYNALVLSADKTALLDELRVFEQTNKELYTSSSYKNWEDAYNEGKYVYNAPNASVNEISSAIKKMKNAYETLVLRGDKTLLYQKMQSLLEIECQLYTPKTVEELNDAYLKALEVFLHIDATQEQIDESINIINAKKSQLIYAADFSALIWEIEAVKLISPSKYTTESINYLKSIYDEAVAVYKDRNSAQEKVNAIQMNLAKAKNSLVECGTKDQLNNVVSEIANINHLIYTTDTLDVLHNYYIEALKLLKGRYSQSEIDNLVSKLTEANTNLKISEERQELYQYLLQVSGKKLQSYSETKVNEFKLAYDDAKKYLYNHSSTIEEVKSAKRKAEESYDKLQSY